MSDNIRTISGEPYTEMGEPVQDVIEALKRFLDMAEAGIIRQIHIIGVTRDGSVERTVAGPGDYIILAGATTWSAYRLCTSLNYREIVPPPLVG